VSQVALHWLSQSFLNYLDWPEVLLLGAALLLQSCSQLRVHTYLRLSYLLPQPPPAPAASHLSCLLPQLPPTFATSYPGRLPP